MACAAVALAALSAGVETARGQSSGAAGASGEAGAVRAVNPRDARRAVIERVELGWGRIVPVERWTPMTIWLGGGESGFTGFVSIEYVQDGSQHARIVLPAAATPGKTTPVEVAATFPDGLNRIKIDLMDSSSGDRIDTIELVETLPDDGQMKMNSLFVRGDGPVVAIGDVSLGRVLDRPDTMPVPDRYELYRGMPTDDSKARDLMPEEAWDELRSVKVSADRMARTWSAYESASAVVVGASDMSRIDPRAREALHRWTMSGGRLVVVADVPGNDWRLALPPGESHDVVALSASARIATPTGLRETLSSSMGRLRAMAERVEAEDAGEVDEASPSGENSNGAETGSTPTVAVPEPVPNAAEAVNARVLSLTPTGERLAWSVRWVIDDGGERGGGGGAGGLVAEGPIGFGWVTILGVDPERVSAVVSRESSAALWFDAVCGSVAIGTTRADDRFSEWERVSGATRGQHNAIVGAMDTLLADRTISAWSFVPVWLSAAALAVLLGPMDAIVLKRLRSRQRSWLTALGWIVAASAIAGTIPAVLRTAPTSIDRLEVLDVRGALDAGSAPVAWRSGVTTVFGGLSETVRWPGVEPGAWVRGVSASHSPTSDRRVLTAMMTIQASMPGADDDAVTNAPESAWVGQWMLRSAADQGPARSLVGGECRRIEGANESRAGDLGAYSLRLWGLPAGAEVEGLGVKLGRSFQKFEGENAGLGGRSVEPDGTWTMDLKGGAGWQSASGVVGQTERGLVLGESADLPGADRRARVIDHLTASGRWALVSLRLTLKGGEGASAARSSRPLFARILLPLDEGSRVDVNGEGRP